ncbi:ADP-ribosylation factor family-domain-containing protein [Lentinula aff. detonsa]|uniref:ADP-ribosylation factor family-domain-containing protein n=1 Tax=Lentinula aff. detonsa TaxID=2804958 RepID=A0AA38KBU6_9AGAR|nr:ADP-ribosylation factor family-domain-containing protein [Lentinula aff. detonsa]
MLNHLLDRFYPNKFRYRIGLSGLDSCGKTTLIHKLKYGEIIETVPTIGVVFTTANLNVPCSKSILRCTVWEVGAPGCSPRSSRSLVKSVLTPSAAIVWLVDGRDRDRLVESVEELQEVVAPEGPNTLSMNAPILILATKQDLSNPIPLDEIQRKFSPAISGRKSAIFRVSLVQDNDNQSANLVPAFDWLLANLKNTPLIPDATGILIPSTNSNPTQGIDVAGESLEKEKQKKLNEWISRAQSELTTEEDFLTQFHSINLPSWDHYTHIRLAYVILTTFGRQKGKNMIFTGIEKYINQSSKTQTRSRTFHVTMTYFWIQIVHFGICRMLSDVAGAGTGATVEGKEEEERENKNEKELNEEKRSRYSTRDSITSDHDSSTLVESLRSFDTTTTTATTMTVSTLSTSPNTQDTKNNEKNKKNQLFAQFILSNPFVTQGNLWEEYYSREVIMSPEAKEGMVFPDRKPLPSLISTSR